VNILLLQLKRIGDLILTTPALAAVRRAYPQAHISLIVARDGRALLPALAGLDDAIALRGNVADATKCLSVLSASFDVCVDFTHNDRSAFLTLLSGARQRITSGYVEQQSRLRARSYTHLLPCSMQALHTIDYHLCMLRPLGIESPPGDIVLELPQNAIDQAMELTGAEEFVLLHPGSARREKLWEPERWAGLIDYLHCERSLRCVLTGAASGFEGEHLVAIRAQTRAPVLDLAGKTSLLMLAAIVARARLLVTVDSAPMHFAAGFGTPQVALFGPTNPFHWRPRSPVACVLQGASGLPLREFTAKQKPLATKLISTEAVIDAMEARLAATAVSPL
jgi:predicted lipopolysaccharide heptosyltransferase III